MKASQSICLAISIFLVLGITNAAGDQTISSQITTPKPQAFLNSLVGKWEGTCRTWFRPGILADESKVKGDFKLVHGGRLLRHT